MSVGGYGELLAATNYSFLRAASHPDEMVQAARALGLAAIGVADRNTLAGVVRAHVAAKEAGVRLLVGARLVLREGLEVAAYPRGRAAYARLCRLLTLGKRRTVKGACDLGVDDLIEACADQVLILCPPAPDLADAPQDAPQSDPEEGGFLPASWRAACERLAAGARAVPGVVLSLALARRFDGADGARLAAHAAFAADVGAPAVVVADALFHTPDRRPLADVLTCIREKTSIDAAGRRLHRNAERHLKSGAEQARLFADYPHALARAQELMAAIDFSLDEIAYQYPDEVVAPGETAMQTLTRLTEAGASRRYPRGVSAKVRAALDHELALIDTLGYAPYFLTVHEMIRFAESRGILAQGRGSAANSAVCYCLGVTAVDPDRVDLLFERFISAERNEPPDIDIDFEHERREEVIQHIYETYGRHRAALAASVVTYRTKSAIREVGKALGLSADMVDALAGSVWGWSSGGVQDARAQELGLDTREPRLAQALRLARELTGFPRHLSQHVGGFVITRDRVDELVPVENAAMPGRTVVEWDKDDLDALGILKVDVLALGMLTCLARAFEFLRVSYDLDYDLESVPAEDRDVYDMICDADTVGVFQIESRAQMTMLPRLKPRSFYDLVIEVAIVRPGPIQGDMVHPFLRRREGREVVAFPSAELEAVLGKTLGVPLFQEQAMKIAIVAAGFTPSQADKLRRAMATFRRTGIIHEFGLRLVEGMVSNGYERDFAERCFRQIEGFGEYGFPESHAASFALLVYVSCWVKHHFPDVFLAAILNAQPMGFYAPAQLVRDARAHGVEVRPPDVNASEWDASLEPRTSPARPTRRGGGARMRCAVRLGLRQIKGLNEVEAAKIIAARQAEGPFASLEQMAARAGVSRSVLERLADADAFGSLDQNRRDSLWRAKGVLGPPLPLFAAAERADATRSHGLDGAAPFVLPAMSVGEEVAHDYNALRLSLRAHPLSLVRARLNVEGATRAEDLARVANGSAVAPAGLVLVRQRPGSANGVIFATLEDETGVANIIIWPKVFERFRRVVLGARLLQAHGRVQREGLVVHVIADRLSDRTCLLDAAAGPDMATPTSPGDEAGSTRLGTSGARRMTRGRRARILPKSRDFH